MTREQEMRSWIQGLLNNPEFELQAISGDASFRHYYRLQLPSAETKVVMDAPPDKEPLAPFVTISNALAKMNVKVPVVEAKDLNKGFALICDLGDTLLSQRMNKSNAGELYKQALSILLCIYRQSIPCQLPDYDEALLTKELALFRDWFLGRHLALTLTAQENDVLESTFNRLVEQILKQPKVFVHRDYHSRNLMWHDDQIALIDFQDAVLGPYTYDAVSLLRDCYMRWSPEQVTQWAREFYRNLNEQGMVTRDEVAFQRDFDWMGLQRHLKAIGIFARLNHRDGKKLYLNDIPRVLSYVDEVCQSYPEFHAFRELLKARVYNTFPIDWRVGNPVTEELLK